MLHCCRCQSTNSWRRWRFSPIWGSWCARVSSKSWSFTSTSSNRQEEGWCCSPCNSSYTCAFQNFWPCLPSHDIVCEWCAKSFQVPDGEMAAGVESDEFRAGMKRRAEKITRAQCEIFSFSKKYNLPRAAMDELIASVGNVSTQPPPVNSTCGHDVM